MSLPGRRGSMVILLVRALMMVRWRLMDSDVIVAGASG